MDFVLTKLFPFGSLKVFFETEYHWTLFFVRYPWLTSSLFASEPPKAADVIQHDYCVFSQSGSKEKYNFWANVELEVREQ